MGGEDRGASGASRASKQFHPRSAAAPARRPRRVETAITMQIRPPRRPTMQLLAIHAPSHYVFIHHLLIFSSYSSLSLLVTKVLLCNYFGA